MNGSRDGFSIIEVVLAMVLLAVILTMLAGLTYTSAVQAMWTSDAAARQAATLAAVNRFVALPFADLDANEGCNTVGSSNNQYEVCVTVDGSATVDTVIIVTTPLQRTVPATTVRLIRNGPPGTNPLCTTGC